MFCMALRKQRVTFALYIINRLGFTTEVESVYCAYALSPYITQIHLFHKEIIESRSDNTCLYIFTLNVIRRCGLATIRHSLAYLCFRLHFIQFIV